MEAAPERMLRFPSCGSIRRPLTAAACLSGPLRNGTFASWRHLGTKL